MRRRVYENLEGLGWSKPYENILLSLATAATLALA
jgi:hypothetical protein